MTRAFPLAAAAALVLAAAAHAALPVGFLQRTLIDGLDLVSSAILPDGRVIAVEKYGKLTLIKPDGSKSVALNWESKTRSNYEAGMMCVLADPGFLANGYLYVQYCNKQQGTNGRDWVSRFTMVGDTIDGASEKKILDLGDAGPNYHHGSGLAVNPKDGMLYVCSGSRHGGGANADGMKAAANKNSVEGKLLRVKIPDGEIPSDNPFYAANTGDAKAVYYYGLRNPFTLSFHPTNGTLWFSDVQPGAGDDEVNQGGPAGTGYQYGGGGSQGPLWTADDVGGGGGGMIGSLWYTGANFPAKYKDTYFHGNVRGWNKLKIMGSDRKQIEDWTGIENPIDVKMDALGAIYVSTRFQTENVRWDKGKVIKIWYGTEEPQVGLSREARSAALARQKLGWRVLPGGRLSVEALREGAQTLRLQALDGRVLASRSLSGRGTVEFAMPAGGVHVLTWQSGQALAAVKVMP